MRRLGVLAALLAAMWLLVGPAAPASAHPIGASAVYLTVASDRVDVELAVPLDKFNQATGTHLEATANSVAAGSSEIRRVVADSLRISDESAQAWLLTVGQPDLQVVNTVPALVIRATAAPPTGTISGDLTLRYSLVVDQVSGHRAFVFLVSDLQAGQVSEGGPQPLGTTQAGQEQLSIPRAGASWGTGFAAMVSVGARHIADGTDHMLFLITLLLAAPLFAFAGRWADRRSVRSASVHTLGIVTAFTLGHTTSLALVSFGLIGFPNKPVEVLVAVSILIAAIHALRPLTSRGEVIIAGVFGLVHGTAFATAILDLGLDTQATVVAVLGFNVGVELAQLTVVLLVLPVFLLLATRPWYRWVRSALAAFAAVAATAWVVAVLTDTDSVLQPLFEVITSAPLLSYGLFVSIAFGAWAATLPLKPPADPETADSEGIDLATL